MSHLFPLQLCLVSDNVHDRGICSLGSDDVFGFQNVMKEASVPIAVICCLRFINSFHLF